MKSFRKNPILLEFFNDFCTLSAKKDEVSPLEDFVEKYKDIENLPPDLIDAMANFKPTNEAKSSELTRWVFKARHNHQDALKALEFVFSKGLPPNLYIPQAGVSVIGLCAYIEEAFLVDLCYKYGNVEDCRLNLSTDHVSDPHYVGSTLLHRVAQRGLDFEVVKAIVRADPLASNQQTQAGQYPDQWAVKDEVREFLRTKRVEKTKELLAANIPSKESTSFTLKM